MLAALGLAACDGPTGSEAAAPAAPPAPATVEQGLNARLIRLKNHLQQNPYSADARLELGLLLLDMANPRAAEAELARAVELGMDPNQSVPPLVRTWNLLGRPKDVLQHHAATRLSRPDAQADLLAEVAVAQARTGNPQAARQMVTQALQLNPGSVSAQLVKAKILLSDGKIDEALGTIDAALAGQGRKLDAWELKGDVLVLVKGDVEAGRAAYREALATSPRYVPLHAKLVMLAIDRNELDDAAKQLGQLQRTAAGSPPALYLAAKLAMARGKVAEARDQITIALTEYPKDLRSLILGAEIELKAGSLRVAEDHLGNALTLAPTLPRIRHLLAQTYMRSGAPEKAEMILEPLLRARNPDATALGLAAEASLQAGLTMRSARLFERAAAAAPGNPRYRTAVALNRISSGDAAGGFAQLEAIAAADSSAYADLALLSARLQGGDLRAAERAAERLVAKQPDRALPWLILGRLKVQQRAGAAARKHFERALELDPAFVPAAVAMAHLDLQDGALAAARQRFERVLQHAPTNVEALVAMADVQRKLGDPPEQVTARLESAIKISPTAPRPRLALINHLLLSGANEAALVAAQDATAQIGEDLNLLDALGRAQMAAGESAQALTTFRRIVSARPKSPEPLLRMADVYASRDEIDSAIDHYRQALALKPDLTAAQIKLVGYETVRKNWREALFGARAVQKRLPKDPAGFHLEGLVYAAQQQWDPAIAAFKAALQRGPSAEVAIQLYGTYQRANRPADAARFGTEWVKGHPGDRQFVGHLAEAAMARRDYPAAESHFRSIVAAEEKNARALNNLAWVLLVQHKPGALDLARRALALDPANVNVMDTLATALARENQLAEALAVQQKALKLAPQAHYLRLGLARIAVQAKDYALAPSNLDQLTALGKAFPAQAEVWQLRQQLQ